MIGTKGRILVVDDDQETRTILRAVLTAAGYQVDLATDGEHALGMLRVDRFDLVLLDMVMPGLNGWGVIRRLQDLPAAPPVITVSGEYFSPAALALAKSHVHAHVLKPFHMATLLVTCTRVMNQRGKEPRLDFETPRKETRCAISAPVTLLAADRSPLAVGRATNISLSGMHVHLGANLVVGQRVRMTLELPGQPEPLELRGVVRWAESGNVGLELTELTPASSRRLDGLILAIDEESRTASKYERGTPPVSETRGR